jgi:hypothetical protein
VQQAYLPLRVPQPVQLQARGARVFVHRRSLPLPEMRRPAAAEENWISCSSALCLQREDLWNDDGTIEKNTQDHPLIPLRIISAGYPLSCSAKLTHGLP